MKVLQPSDNKMIMWQEIGALNAIKYFVQSYQNIYYYQQFNSCVSRYLNNAGQCVKL